MTSKPRAPVGSGGFTPGPAAPTGVDALFDDLSIDEAVAEPALPEAGGTPFLAPALGPGGPWPSAVPGAPEAADALGAGLRGEFAPEGSPLAVVAEVMAGMSPLERAVLVGEPQPVDVEPIRRAAVMRVRVAIALATAPQAPGAATDPAAVSALLAEMDGLLSEVNALLTAAPPETQPALEQVRNALVKEAIDFSEIAHRASSAEPPAPAAAEAEQRASARRAAGTRVLAIESAAEREAGRSASRRRAGLWVGLAVAAAVAAAFHGERLLRAREAASALPAGRTGAPADALISATPAPGSAVVIQGSGGRPLTPEELKRIEDAEFLRGNAVHVVGRAVLVVPAGAGAGSLAAPRGPASGPSGGGQPSGVAR